MVIAFGVYQFLMGLEEKYAIDFSLVPVYRAAEFIPEGTDGAAAIESELVRIGESPLRYLPENVVTSEEQLVAVLTGRIAAGPISAGSMITADQWSTIDAAPI